VETQAPWALAKEPDGGPELDATLASLTRALLVLATLLQPILPSKMADLAARLGLDSVPTLKEAQDLDLAGNAVNRGDPLFPRVDLQKA
jgi:methionyl-tRNA synthetase